MVGIYCTVRSQILLMESRYGTGQSRSTARHARLRQTALQAMFYVLAWMNTFLWVGVARVFEDMGATDGLFGIRLMSAIFFPLQGFCNFLIFVRPRWQDLRQRYPEESSSGLLRRMLSAKPGTYTRSGSWMSRLSRESSFRGGFLRPPSPNPFRGWGRSSILSLSTDGPQRRIGIGRSDDDSGEILRDLEGQTHSKQTANVAEPLSDESEYSPEAKSDEASSNIDTTEMYDQEPTTERGTESSDNDPGDRS